MTDNYTIKDTEIDILIRKNETLKDEISELQRKNSELEIELQAMRNAANLYKTEVKRVQTEKVKLHKLFPKMITTAKAEAIKEFAERLTDRADLLKTSGLDYRWTIWQDDIDNLVKEMTEVRQNDL